MAAKKKYFLGHITTVVGEIETDCTVRFITGGNPDRYLDRLAKNWMSDRFSSGPSGHLFNGGEVCIRGDAYIEVTQSTWEGVSRLIHQH